MRVAVIGGGPAGLYFAILLKRDRPDARITVVERNRPDDTFGFGVVFSDQTLDAFAAADCPAIGPSSRISPTGTTSRSTSAAPSTASAATASAAARAAPC